jgi:cytochrome P450
VEVAGQAIPEGAMVVPMWGAASQDPEVFPEPRTFDLHRADARKHLTFGACPHFCAGAEMARVEARVAFEVLLARLDDLRLAPGTTLEHHLSFAARGYREVPLVFTAAV